MHVSSNRVNKNSIYIVFLQLDYLVGSIIIFFTVAHICTICSKSLFSHKVRKSTINGNCDYFKRALQAYYIVNIIQFVLRKLLNFILVQ